MYNKKILVISSNPMSNIFNNGKTLVAFFDNYPKENLAQLYFSAAVPDSDVCSTYFRISDMDMLNYRLKRKNNCGQEVEAVKKIPTKTKDEGTIQNIKKNNFTRLAREFLWGGNWNTEELFGWLDEFSPELVFFLAGDVIYSHRICRDILNRYNIKMAMYITDDYILPRYNFDIIGHIRRTLIKKWMRTSIQRAEILFTISEPMKECYRKIFGKDSYVAANMYEPLCLDDKAEERNKNYVITYAGGLHYNRDKIILKLAQIIEIINKKNINKKIVLKIYSGSKISKKMMEELKKNEYLFWEGLVGPTELEQCLRCSDYLLHVESFDKKNIRDTKLSLSTKIPEYMSYHKPIIAIGPAEVASIKYLKDCALCITNRKSMQLELEKKIFDLDAAMRMADLSYAKYKENHNKKKKQVEIIQMIVSIRN